MPTLPPIADDLGRRTSIWQTLSTLFLDIELRPADLDHLAIELVRSGYTDRQLIEVMRHEVLPVVGWNLLTPAGVHEAFDSDWLASEIQRRANGWRRYVPTFPMARLIPQEWATVLWLFRFYNRPGMVLGGTSGAFERDYHVSMSSREGDLASEVPTYDSVRALVKAEVALAGIRMVVVVPTSDDGPDANLIAFASTGFLVWRLPPPTCMRGTSDAYVDVAVQNGRVVAWSWSGIRIEIDPQSGRVLGRAFTK